MPDNEVMTMAEARVAARPGLGEGVPGGGRRNHSDAVRGAVLHLGGEPRRLGLRLPLARLHDLPDQRLQRLLLARAVIIDLLRPRSDRRVHQLLDLTGVADSASSKRT